MAPCPAQGSLKERFCHPFVERAVVGTRRLSAGLGAGTFGIPALMMSLSTAGPSWGTTELPGNSLDKVILNYQD